MLSPLPLPKHFAQCRRSQAETRSPASRGGTCRRGAKSASLPVRPKNCRVMSCQGGERALKGVVFSRAVGMAGGTPAFPASRVLGARASRSHGGRNALLGNAVSRHARKKPTPLRGEGWEWGDFAPDERKRVYCSR